MRRLKKYFIIKQVKVGTDYFLERKKEKKNVSHIPTI